MATKEVKGVDSELLNKVRAKILSFAPNIKATDSKVVNEALEHYLMGG